MTVPFRFRIVVLISITLIFISLKFLIIESQKKTEYTSSTGVITYIGNTFNNLPFKHVGKMRYIKIDNYQYPFEIFIGKDFGDFAPKYERIDNLKQGDIITVYYYEKNSTIRDGVNNFTQFIDKGNISFFEKGPSNILGITMIILSVSISVFGFVGWKKGKIKF